MKRQIIEYAATVDTVLNALMQDDSWEDMLAADPLCEAADEALSAKLNAVDALLPDTAPQGAVYDDLYSAIYSLIGAHDTLAFLYGFRVATALQSISADPAPLTRRILNRVDYGRARTTENGGAK